MVLRSNKIATSRMCEQYEHGEDEEPDCSSPSMAASYPKIRNYSRILRRDGNRSLSPNLWISVRSSSKLETVASYVWRRE